MQQVGDFFRGKVIWAVIALSLAAGLIAAYGRERNAGRAPGKDWWKTRLYIMPFMAIFSAWAVSRFGLTPQDAALISSILSLMGYEALNIILTRARKASDKLADVAIGGDGPVRPYSSLVDTDDSGRATAHVEITNHAHPRRGALGSALRTSYKAAPDEPLPPDMVGLLDMLDEENPDDL